ncbi:hypothetical protein L3Y34_011659 [Caenorhabditis briggsae]|uniref:Uncharacterized protein n=1 Tax=Caenorhabditis briggsae TaxID=6238 RepID=A0AAE9CU77_CAEBR|nr:hypothetical protein L3Y34_011659 [Caenorhabditis briggsae]
MSLLRRFLRLTPSSNGSTLAQRQRPKYCLIISQFKISLKTKSKYFQRILKRSSDQNSKLSCRFLILIHLICYKIYSALI